MNTVKDLLQTFELSVVDTLLHRCLEHSYVDFVFGDPPHFVRVGFTLKSIADLCKTLSELGEAFAADFEQTLGVVASEVAQG